MDHLGQMAWDDLRYVRAVADCGSVRGAAATLGISHQTVARHIARLERALGAQLFVKSSSGYRITLAAEELVRTATQVDELIGAATRRLSAKSQHAAGEIRLTTIEWLMPALCHALPEFHQTYPAIRLVLSSGTTIASLGKREADVAIRLAREPMGDLVGRQLAISRAGIFASHDYLARVPAKRPLDEHAWVGLSGAWAALRPGQWLREHVPEHRVVVRSSVASAIPDLIRAGLGVGLLPCFVGDADPALHRVRPELIDALEVPVWLLTHPDLRRAARVRALMDFLTARLEAHVDRLEGRSPRG